MLAMPSKGAYVSMILELLVTSVILSTAMRDENGAKKEMKVFKVSVQAARRATGGMQVGAQDWAHSSIYEYLSRAQVVEESAEEGTASPEHLTVKANGRELAWDKASRPGRVNPNRVLISVRWVELLSANATKLVVRLTGVGSNVLCSASLHDGLPHLLHKTDQLERLEDGMAVACHDLPEEAQLKVHVIVQLKGSDDVQEKWWDVETADVSSGDAQGRIMFLPADYNVSELKRRHGLMVRHIVAGGALEDRLVAKEMTIFDADQRDSGKPAMDIRVNGFEFDTSGSLREAVQAFQEQLHGSPEEEAREESYDISCESWTIEKCVLLTQEDLDVWVQAAKNHSEGNLSPTKLPCRKSWNWNQTHEVKQDSEFLGFGQTCWHSDILDKYVLQCNETVEPDQISNEKLELPVQVEIAMDPRKEINKVSRPQLGFIGVTIATADESTRELIMKQMVTKPTRLSSHRLVKVLNPNDAQKAIDIIMGSAEAAQKLVEAMERRASEWWKSKTGDDTKSACFSVNYRHTRGGMGGLPVAHVDAIHVAEWFRDGGAFPPASQARVNGLLGMPIKDALKHVVVTFNEWINAGPEPIVELPLTIMDTTTLDETDLKLAWVQASLDSKMVKWSEAHRWYYRKVQAGEGYMFITSPHVSPHQTFTGTPHSAFRFIRKENAAASRPRQSFEFRCLVIDTTWTSPSKLFESELPKAPTQEQIVQSGANSIMSTMVMDSKAFMRSLQDNEDMVATSPNASTS